jgi:GNAT superfamily N-acetyltransferase
VYRLRRATIADIDFLVDVVVAVTREQGRLTPDFDELAFRAGHAAWTAQQIADPAGESTTYVIEVAGRPAGRLRVVRAPDQIQLGGIQLSPGHRSCGIGTRIIPALLAEARAAGLPVTLTVDKDNPRAHALYVRLGFAEVGETGDEVTMRRS